MVFDIPFWVMKTMITNYNDRNIVSLPAYIGADLGLSIMGNFLLFLLSTGAAAVGAGGSLSGSLGSRGCG